MGLVSRTAYVAGGTVTAAGQNSNENAVANEFNGNIENVNIKSSAAIAASKLDLSSIAQVMAMTSKIFKAAKGADVASAAGEITLGDDGNYFDITGTAAITSIVIKAAGTMVVLQFDSTASLVDGSNLKLQGNFQGAAESQIALISDGTNWFEVCRNNNVNGPAFHVHKNGSDQGSIATGTTTTVTWGTESFDTNSNFASDTFTPTVAGKYFLHATIHWTVGVDQTTYVAYIYKNGTVFKQGPIIQASGTGALGNDVSCIVEANGSTDAFIVRVTQNSGGDKIIEGDALSSFFEGYYLRT